MNERQAITVPGAPTLLLVLFVALKLTGVIEWSWWWVVSPVWIPLLIGVVVIAVAAAIIYWR